MSGRDRRAFWILWTGALLLVPLPYLVAVEGCVPVVRFAFVAALAGSYALAVDASGVVGTLTLILALHAAGYALVLALAARILLRLVPAGWRERAALGLVAAGLVVALALPIYRTPFDDAHLRTRWTGLFQ